MLLPASLQDWLPKRHLAYFISDDTVDALDLKAFYARYAGGGARNQPFHPGHDGQAAGLRLRHRRVQLAQDRAPAARRPGLSDAGRGELPQTPHDP